jgi:hypothetical protein
MQETESPKMSNRSIEEIIARLEERQVAHYELSAEKWKTFEEKTDSFFEKLIDHEGQLGQLTKWQSQMNGVWKATVVIATLVGFVIGIVVQMK